ncbi:cytochrome P450 [Armillaria solidipes]|uniref:Cytochrome P450 n=1 Tax=Armillaria solidipes TaxID=1076256 RepID=A0A2H3AJC2_9AGAR|nr:cytochrome P450 [Armillaria solidipes]
MSPLILISLALLLVILLLVLLPRRSKNSFPRPPGPKGLPVIGNLLESLSLSPSSFAKWTAETGSPIVSLNVFGQTIVILNSWKVTSELLEKRGSIYSDRPKPVWCGELIGWKSVVLFAPYGERLREQRRLVRGLIDCREHMEKILSVDEMGRHWKEFLGNLLREPEALDRHIHNTSVGILLQLSHGISVDDHIQQNTDSAMKQFSIVTAPGASIVDLFPPLQYLPKWFPASFIKQAAEYARVLADMVDVPHGIVKQHLSESTANPSFTSTYLQRDNVTPEQEELIKWTAASIYFGGSNTSVPTLLTFFLAMSLHPEVQRRAQAEVDAVTGGTRLPTLEDRAQGRLPYVEAIVQETFRWNPATPIGGSFRETTKDDVYEGYLIPKGSIVMPNIYGFLHDPETYKDPMTFNPDRFMGKDRERDPRPPCFGFGRRACPALGLGETNVFLAVSVTLATFNITSKSKTKTRLPSPEYFTTGGTISRPKPFDCNIRPRNERAVTLITAEND